MEALVIVVIVTLVIVLVALVAVATGATQHQQHDRRTVQTQRVNRSTPPPIRTVQTARRPPPPIATLERRAPDRIPVATAQIVAARVDALSDHARCGWCGDPIANCVASGRGPAVVCDTSGCHGVSCRRCFEAYGRRCPGRCGLGQF